MPKKTVDLFGEADEEDDYDDEGGAMLSGKASAALHIQDTRAEGEEETRPPEKKVCFLIIIMIVVVGYILIEFACSLLLVPFQCLGPALKIYWRV